VRRLTIAASALALLATTLTVAPSAAQQQVRIGLIAQSSFVDPGGQFDVRVALAGEPPGASVQLVLHGRVRDRDELVASFAGDDLRAAIYRAAPVPLAERPPDPVDGGIPLAMPLAGPANTDPARIRLTTAGVYPVEVRLLDAGSVELGRLITHLVLRPASFDARPPLAVGVVLDIAADPSLQPDLTTTEPDLDVAALSDVIDVVAARPDVPLTLAPVAETVDALAASTDPLAPALVDRLRSTMRGREVVNRGYVDVQPEALQAADLDGELEAQLLRGRDLLEDQLQATVDDTVWLAGPSLDDDGVDALAALGLEHIVLPAGATEEEDARFTATQPFAIDSATRSVDAMLTDDRLSARLGRGGSDPLLVAHQLLADIALIWFEQPEDRRGIVIRPAAIPDPETLEQVLVGLAAGGAMLDPVTLSGLFDDADPLLDRTGERIERALDPADGDDLDRVAPSVRRARDRLTSYESLIGPLSARSDPYENLLLLGTASEVDSDDRDAYVGAVFAAVDAAVDAIDAPARQTITLTARDGTIPLTIRKSVDFPVNVVVHLRSQKLEFPEGERRELTLTEETTRIDIGVRTLSSGAFPLDIEVTSPDGGLEITSSRFTVRSTAVSGVGVVLSAGAGLFLLVWWASHWRKTRRSRRLVDPA
jgi:hypothetical protein